jgi:DnaJ-class molecular chaperone
MLEFGPTNYDRFCPACEGYGATACGTCDGTGQAAVDEAAALNTPTPRARRGAWPVLTSALTAPGACTDCRGAGAFRCLVCHGNGKRGQTAASLGEWQHP